MQQTLSEIASSVVLITDRLNHGELLLHFGRYGVEVLEFWMSPRSSDSRQAAGNGARHYRRIRNNGGRQVGVLEKRPKRRRNRHAKEKVDQQDGPVDI